MKLYDYTFEVTDSDGRDSVQEIRAASLKKAQKMAYNWHGNTLYGCDPDTWPYMWARLTWTTEKIVCDYRT